MRKAVVIVGVLVAIAASAYGYYTYTRKAPAPSVTTARTTRGDIAETVGATGQLQAVTTVQVGTQVSGTILALNADFNSLVRKGQVLARLDPSLFQTQIEQARANLIRAEADLERLRVSSDDMRNKLRRAQELSDKKLIAQTELEAAEVSVRSAEAQVRSQQAAVTQAQAALRQNEVNLQHTVIEAPIDGLVISRNVDVGQTVAASMSAPTLFLLAADLAEMQVIASLDESDVGRIRPGQSVRFRVDAYPTEEFTGKVTQIRLQPQTVQNVVTYSTIIEVPNPELKLKPGMTANVNIEIARRTDVLRVPNAALRFRPTAEIFTALGQTPPQAASGRSAGAPATTTTEPKPETTRAPAQTAEVDEGQALRGSGRGTGNGGGRGGNLAERMAGLSPEQRAQLMERMRARGVAVPAQPAQSAAPAKPAATTIDALFGPLTTTETGGQIWLHVNGQLQRVRVRLGITDGQQTELIRALDGDIQADTEVVTAVSTGVARATTAAAPSAFPGLGTGRQVFPGGGGGGFGGVGRGGP